MQYKITFEDGTEEMTQESNVKSDRLRIIAKAENDKEVLDAITEEAVKFVPPPPPPPPMDENTGVSVWQTVAVKEVDEDEEYDSHQKAVEDMYKLKASDEKVLLVCLCRMLSLFGCNFFVSHCTYLFRSCRSKAVYTVDPQEMYQIINRRLTKEYLLKMFPFKW